MKTKSILILSIGLALLPAAASGQIESKSVRYIRLKNLERDWTGKKIRFVAPLSGMVKGVLLKVTDTDLILSGKSGNATYRHEGVEKIEVLPGMVDMIMVTGISLLGALSGILATEMLIATPGKGVHGAAGSLGIIGGFMAGNRAFYKPFMIDISGRAL